MSVNVLKTDERRATLMKKGACFKCEQVGHLSKDCPTKKQKPDEATTTRTEKVPQTKKILKKGKELFEYARSLVDQLDEAEKKEFKEAEKEDF